VGAANAALAAIGGHARLWDASGVWRTARARDWYGWKTPVRGRAGWCGAAAALVAPVLLVVATGIVGLPAGIPPRDRRQRLRRRRCSRAYAGWLQTAFAGPRLPTFVPRLG
jgi:hypothetical protein